MKLYFAPGACSLSPHIVLRELGIPFDLIKVDMSSKKTSDGDDFASVNPKGYVPALKTDDGKVLTEGVAINQFLADKKPEAGLAPANGTFERYKLQEMLNFISTEIHKTYSPLFNSSLPDAARDIFMDKLKKRFGELDTLLSKQDFLTGSKFTIADAYLYTVLRWAPKFKIDIKQWPALARFYDRVDSRPAVKAAVEAENAAKAA
ncbi:MAG TPA: glutathione transferase GstA [Rudaea sp.]|jgi:glutathione S-transferase|nr:glutathione transferase GstA [Rudaea sp.]